MRKKKDNKYGVAEFDASEFLDSKEMIAEYLNAVIAENDDALFYAALGNIAKAQGMSKLAADTGLGRESLLSCKRT